MLNRSSAIVTAIGAAALALAGAARADQQPGYENGADLAPSPVAMVADLAIARPLGLGATVLGTVIFVAGLPFELLSGNVSDPARRLVVQPARFTFTRPLGQEVN